MVKLPSLSGLVDSPGLFRDTEDVLTVAPRVGEGAGNPREREERGLSVHMRFEQELSLIACKSPEGVEFNRSRFANGEIMELE